ncbi:MAG TPA: hypothetical protein VFV08_13615, partial [Puia sp.]|nr:hypothetical protein [Puia sp.]
MKNANRNIIYRFNRVYLLVLLLIIFGQLSAQNDAENPLNSFNTWHKEKLQEKIFVHTDQDQYLTGEIIWFKLYYLDAAFHHHLDLSKIAYVELLDQSNKPVQQCRISLDSMDSKGSLEIPKNLPGGYYRLRSYTRWMKNYPADYFFEKTIAIYNPFNNLKDSFSQNVLSYDCGIFPEGGDLVNGIESRVAFHVTNQYGDGISGKGWLLNETNDTLSHLETNSLGMGEFQLKP